MMNSWPTFVQRVRVLAEVVNLRQKRKEKAREDKEKRAAENRVKFGRSKAQKKKETFEQLQNRKTVDDAKRDDE